MVGDISGLDSMVCSHRQKDRERGKGVQVLMYECFHCGTKGVIWDADFMFDEMGYDEDGQDGLVHICHCVYCGREIEYRIYLGREEDDE